MYIMQICFDFKNNFFFFNHKLHAGRILNFGRYLRKHPKTPEIDQNDPKYFQSGIGWVTVSICLQARYFPAVPARMEQN